MRSLTYQEQRAAARMRRGQTPDLAAGVRSAFPGCVLSGLARQDNVGVYPVSMIDQLYGAVERRLVRIIAVQAAGKQHHASNMALKDAGMPGESARLSCSR